MNVTDAYKIAKLFGTHGSGLNHLHIYEDGLVFVFEGDNRPDSLPDKGEQPWCCGGRWANVLAVLVPMKTKKKKPIDLNFFTTEGYHDHRSEDLSTITGLIEMIEEMTLKPE